MMILDLSPYELIALGAVVSAYLIKGELQHRKYINCFKNICWAIGLKPQDFDLH